MNKQEAGSIILLVILGLVIFVAGGALGFYYYWQKNNSSSLNTVDSQELIRQLSSPGVPSIIVYGQISSISSDSMNIFYQNSTIPVLIDKNVVVNSYSGSDNSAQKKIEISALKEGDYVNVATKMNSSGQLQAQSIVVVPSTTAQ